MDMTTAAAWIAFSALYLFAGRQTFLLMLLTDPEADGCPITEGYRRGDTAFWITFAAFLAVWPALFCIASLRRQ